MIELRIKPHTGMSKEMIEVWRDGKFVAGVYPHLDGIRVVSKYFQGIRHEGGSPPSAVIVLKS